VRALTLTQPWATLLATGYKCFETRSWSTSYRGSLAIHAAKGFPEWARELCRDEPFRDCLDLLGYEGWDELPVGRFVGVVQLVDVRSTASVRRELEVEGDDIELAFGDFGPRRFAWRVTRPVRVEPPIPYRGTQGLWVPGADVLAQLQGLVAS
jgi:activating signal cointegrator 1